MIWCLCIPWGVLKEVFAVHAVVACVMTNTAHQICFHQSQSSSHQPQHLLSQAGYWRMTVQCNACGIVSKVWFQARSGGACSDAIGGAVSKVLTRR